jgi:DNA adenine methylase
MVRWRSRRDVRSRALRSLRKPRAYAEVYNDLDDEVVNVFRVLRDPSTAEELRKRTALTAFARTEFKAAYEPATDAVDAAHKTIVRAFMGFGSASMTRMHITGFRSNSSRSGTTPATDWAHWPAHVSGFTERLRGVVIENRDFAAVIGQHDSDGTLFYVDPPYVQSTRSSLKTKNGNRGHYYRHDMTDDDHRRLAGVLMSLTGMVVLSGYRSPLYEGLYGAWDSTDHDTYADGARRRVETLWFSPAASTARGSATPMFPREASA